MSAASKYEKLRAAVHDLYFAAWWTPDRECDVARLWERVRDAADIDPGTSAGRLGGKRA